MRAKIVCVCVCVCVCVREREREIGLEVKVLEPFESAEPELDQL